MTVGLRSQLQRARWATRRVARWFGTILLAWALLNVVHQSYVLAVAYTVRWLGNTSLARSVVEYVPIDPVHARLALESVSGVEPLGVSVGGPVAEAVNHLVPGADLKPHNGPAGCRCLVSLRVQPESPFAGVAFMITIGLVSVLATGVLLAASRRYWPSRAGLLIVLYGLLSVAVLPWGLAELEAAGFAAVATKLLEVDGADYQALRGVMTVLLPTALKMSIAGVGLAIGIGLVYLYRRALPSMRRSASSFAMLEHSDWLQRPRVSWNAPVSLALVGALFLTGFRGAVSYARQDPTDGRAAAPGDLVRVRTEPSVVRVERNGQGFRYFVNGEFDVIRGMGYNLRGREATTEATDRRLRRDFRQMRLAGVNTVIGWNQDLFDEALLNAANLEGLGVVLPFELPTDVDYRDALVRQVLLDQVSAWVVRYHRHPALRMWGLGNEVLHDLTVRDGERYAAFAQFLVTAVDRIHALDPDHPVIYREAEDVFVPIIDEAMREKPADRIWFVYGLNFYTPRLEQALALWQSERFPYAVVVSEFGPHSFHPSSRGTGYLALWRMIRRFSNITLGGVAYVWYTQGPEAIDTVFGLVDDEGKAVDGALDALTHAYLLNKQSVEEWNQRLMMGETPTPRRSSPTSVRPTVTALPDPIALPTGNDAQRIIDAVVMTALSRGLTGFEVQLDRRVGDAVVTKVKPSNGAGQWYEAVLRESGGAWTVIGFGPRPPG